MREPLVEFGRVSSKGQVAIPARIRKAMNLKQGSRVVFSLHNNRLVVSEIAPGTFARITEPLRKAMKGSTMTDQDVVDIVRRVRAKRAARRA